ncbi:MAG: hypothetical protein REDVDVYQ_002263 [Candidatus Fervidibacter sp.]
MMEPMSRVKKREGTASQEALCPPKKTKGGMAYVGCRWSEGLHPH